MKITWLGTASILVEAGGTKLLFDPFVPLHGAKLWTGAWHEGQKTDSFRVRLRDFDEYTHILVTHGHFDHISSIPAIIARNPDSHVYCTRTPRETLRKAGVPEKNLSVIAAGEELHFLGEALTQFSGEINVRTWQGRHADLETRNPKLLLQKRNFRVADNLVYILKANRQHPEHGETLFYEIQAEGKRVQLMGSLNLADDVVYPRGADLLILPYSGYADNLPKADSVIRRLAPEKVLLDHFDDPFPPVTTMVDLRGIREKYGDQIAVIGAKESYFL